MRVPIAIMIASAVLAGVGAGAVLLLVVTASTAQESAAPPPVTPPPAPSPPAAPTTATSDPGPRPAKIRWRRSRSVGTHTAGRLVRGVQLPSSGVHYATWDPVLRRSPDRHWRRWGHDRAIRTTLRVIKSHRRANPDAPRVLVGDISRPRGGDFGIRFGRPGHVSHQIGLDVDLYYPRKDRREIAPTRVRQIDTALAQDLVNRLVSAGAQFVFVGPNTGLKGPPGVVQALPHHDNHIHVRFPARASGR